MASISASVGSGGVNKVADVSAVQKLLNKYLAAHDGPPLATGGTIDPGTLLAIQSYQKDVAGIASPDGRIDPGGKTWKALDAGQGFAPLSGVAWWQANQASFPNSDKIADLAAPFRDNAAKFVKALTDAGASVTISATLRNATRARLMRNCWDVANGIVAPKDVAAIPGVAINWDHGILANSKKAAQDMVNLISIAVQPALNSLHITGKAIDMTIEWTGTLKIKDATGATKNLGAPRTGADNTGLHAVGATYKLFKLVSDRPHWSENGH
ncbi:MAG: peptidoglycan-binding domain-containing protein [Pseudomonadota bacterium]